MDSTNSQLKLVVKAVDEASADLKRVNSQLATLGLTSKNASRDTHNLSQSLKQSGKQVSNFGRTLMPLSVVGAAAIGGMAKAAIDFEDSFAGVRKTVDASEAEFSQLAKNFRELSKEIPVSTTELNGIAEIAGQLGVSGVDSITKFTSTVAKIGVTTNLAEEEAAQAFARISNIMQEPIDNVDKMASSVVDLGNNFATTESEIVNFASKIAGAGKIAGLTSANIFGIGTAMSSVGVEAEAGGTAVQKVLIGINTAVVEGNENLDVFAETAGLSVSKFSDLWERDAAAAFSQFVQGLGNAGDDAIMILDELELKDQRLIRAFLSLANAGDLVEKSIDKSNKAFDENTALTEEAEKRFATMKSELKLVKNQVIDAAISLGEDLMPYIKEGADLVTGLARAFRELSPAGRKTVLMITGLVTILPPLLIIAGKVVSAVGVLAGAFSGLTAAAGAAGGAAGIGAMLGPVGWGALAVAALGGIAFGAFKLTQNLTESAKSAELAAGSYNLLTIAEDNHKRAIQEKEQAEKNLKKAQKERDLQEEARVTASQAKIEAEKQLARAVDEHGRESEQAKTAAEKLETAEYNLEDQMWNSLEANLQVTSARSDLKLAVDDLRRAEEFLLDIKKRNKDMTRKLADQWGNLGDKALQQVKPIQKFQDAINIADGRRLNFQGKLGTLQNQVGETQLLLNQLENTQQRLQGGSPLNINRGSNQGGLRVGGNANGGSVSMNRPTWVGERGPEIFVPQTAGKILPSEAVTNNSTSTNIYGNINLGSAEAVQEFFGRVDRANRLASQFGTQGAR